MKTQVYQPGKAFALENGFQLQNLQLSYSCIGELNSERSNVIWICHALTANALPTEWWEGMIGPGKVFDPEHYFIICVNMPGSCYGSTDALSIDPETSQPYYHSFPQITVRDMVNAFEQLRKYLEIPKISLITGGSMGGQQALEWAVLNPNLFEYLIPIATNAFHSPWGIAFNESQRMAIEADPSWKDKKPNAGRTGMMAARSIALLSYRNYQTYQSTQTDPNIDLLDNYRASSYQQYQGEKLAKRFHAFSYWNLSKGMDSHQLGRGRGSTESALGTIQAKTLAIGISSDILFPPSEQQYIVKHIKHARYAEIESLYGHDGFLIETKALTNVIKDFWPQPPL